MDEERDIRYFLRIKRSQFACNKSRRTAEEIVTFCFTNVDKALRPDMLMERVIEELFRRLRKYAKADPFLKRLREPTHIGFSLQNETMITTYHVGLRSPLQNSPSAIAAEIEWVAQSNENLRLLKGDLHARTMFVWLPRDGYCAADARQFDHTGRKSKRQSMCAARHSYRSCGVSLSKKSPRIPRSRRRR